MRGEFYRLLRKKSAYAYFGALAAAYFLAAFVRSGGFGAESALRDASNFFLFLPPVAGGFVFASVYVDDLNSKTLTALVGAGVGKAQIVLTKLAVALCLNAAVFVLAPLFHLAAYATLGAGADAQAAASVFIESLRYFLMSAAYSAMSGVVVYGLQRATFAVAAYLLLSFGVVGGLIAAAFRQFAPGLADYLVPGVVNKLISAIAEGTPALMPFAIYALYLAAAAAVSVAAFEKKEMEF